MRIASLVALAFAVLAVPAQAKFTHFQTPSGNIGCAIQDAGKDRFVRCDLRSASNDPPPKPASCEFDWGFAFGLTATGKGRRLCVSDTPVKPGARVLAYGSSITRGPFTCRSRRSGLRCTNRRRHGFEISRQRQRLF